jgi:rod shape-determining protein MreD
MATRASPATPQHILLPVKISTMVASFAAALLLNFLPWPDILLAPDFVALVLVFWCVQQPRTVGLAVGWTLGLLIDAGNGVLLGQHALAYSLLAFASISLARRILWFGLARQALHVAALLLFSAAVAVVVRLAAGAEFPGWRILVGPLAGAMLWPLASFLLLLPQRRPVEVDETRPI